MPPKRKNNVPSGAAKGRRPRVAGTRGRQVEPGNSAATEPVDQQVNPTPSADQTPQVEKNAPEPEAKAVESPAAEASEGVALEKATTTAKTEKPAQPVDVDAAETKTPAADPVDKAAADPVDKAAADSVDKTDVESEADSESVTTPAKTKVANRMPRLGARPQSETASQSDEATSASNGPSRVTWRLVAILGVIALILGIFAVVAAFKPFARFDNTAWIDEPTTAEVSAAAKEASEATFSYGFETVDADFDRARTFMNDEMRKEFDQTADTTKTAVQQTKTATQAEVTDVGVSMLDGDRATLVGFMNVSSTNEGAAQGSTAGSLVIDMERIDGKWVLAGIRDA